MELLVLQKELLLVRKELLVPQNELLLVRNFKLVVVSIIMCKLEQVTKQNQKCDSKNDK